MTVDEISNDLRLEQSNRIIEDNGLFYTLMRITGSGIKERNDSGDNFLVDRKLEDVFSPEFLTACEGLVITLNHPPELLTEENYKQYEVGRITRPYIQGDEVYGIGVFPNKDIAEIAASYSSSPSTVSDFIPSESGIKKENILFLNHLAICQEGFWDNLNTNKSKGVIEMTSDQMKWTKVGDASPEIKGEWDISEKVDKILAMLEGKEKTEDASPEIKGEWDISEKLDRIEKMLGARKTNDDFEKVIARTPSFDEDAGVGSEDKIDDLNRKFEELKNLISSFLDIEKKEHNEIGMEPEKTDKIDAEVKALDAKKACDSDEELEVEIEDPEEEEDIEEVIDTVNEISDSATMFKKPKIKITDNSTAYLGKVLKANKELLDPKYAFLAGGVNKSNFSVAMDALKNLKIKCGSLANENADKKIKRVISISENSFCEPDF